MCIYLYMFMYIYIHLHIYSYRNMVYRRPVRSNNHRNSICVCNPPALSRSVSIGVLPNPPVCTSLCTLQAQRFQSKNSPTIAFNSLLAFAAGPTCSVELGQVDQFIRVDLVPYERPRARSTPLFGIASTSLGWP